MIAYIDNPNGLTVFVGGNNVKFEADSPKYDAAVDILEDPIYTDEEKSKLLQDLHNQVEEVAEASFEEVAVPLGFQRESDGSVSFNGRVLHGALAQKVESMLGKGMKNLGAIEAFLARLSNNPSATAIDELYDFLSYKELPITSDGFFLAYKGVMGDYWSVAGNKRTRVLKGRVDDSGRIFNGIGEEIEVERQDVDDRRERHCSHGLHVGSKDYAVGHGALTVVVKVDPADVVSVPNDCSFQKLRCCKYKVLCDFSEEIEAPVADESRKGAVVEVNHRSDLANKIDRYLEGKRKANFATVNVRQIQNAMSPEYPSAHVVLKALDSLDWWYDINNENIGATVVELG